MSCNLFRVKNVGLENVANLIGATDNKYRITRSGDVVISIVFDDTHMKAFWAANEKVLVGQFTLKPDDVTCDDLLSEVKEFLN